MRLDFPATGRNREPIREVLEQVLPAAGLLLEVASGSGQHAAWLAGCFPGITWQPSDPDPDHRASIDAWREHDNPPNLLPALDLDASADAWPIERADVVFCANMIHIAPMRAVTGLFAGAGRILDPGGLLITYGPYARGEATEPSNLAFHESLKRRNPEWGLRELGDIIALAAENGLVHERSESMPANNLTLVFRRA